MSILELKPGQKAYINKIYGNNKLSKRLLALGCIEGTPVFLKRTAPLGDPIVINFRGFDIAIRKKDARNIHIKEA